MTAQAPSKEQTKHERRVTGHVSGWQEQHNTCVCGEKWPCPKVGWRASGFAVYEPSGELVAHTGVLGNRLTSEQNEAHARLIAGAVNAYSRLEPLQAPPSAHRCDECGWTKVDQDEFSKLLQRSTPPPRVDPASWARDECLCDVGREGTPNIRVDCPVHGNAEVERLRLALRRVREQCEANGDRHGMNICSVALLPTLTKISEQS